MKKIKIFKNNRFKFRVWDNVRNQYLSEFANFYWHVPYSLNGEELEGEANLQDLSMLMQHENFVVQQYTGMRDKNGKEIYEGDFVKASRQTETLTGRVQYDAEYGAYRLIASDILSFTFYQLVDLEIIGNI